MTSREAFLKWFEIFNHELIELGVGEINAHSAAVAWNAANKWRDGDLFDEEDGEDGKV